MDQQFSEQVVTVPVTCGAVARNLKLTVITSGRPLMRCVPGNLNFGTVYPGQQVCRTVLIEKVLKDPITYLKVDAVDGVECKITETEERYELALTMTGRKSIGTTVGEFEIWTDSRFRDRIKLPYTVRFRPEIYLTTPIVSFGRVSTNEKYHRKVLVCCRNGVIGDVDISEWPDQYGCRATQISDNRWLLDVSAEFDEKKTVVELPITVTKKGDEKNSHRLKLKIIAYLTTEKNS